MSRETDGAPTIRVTDVLIERNGDALDVRATGECQPDRCEGEWGTRVVVPQGSAFVVDFDLPGWGGHSFVFRLLDGEVLHVDGGRRAEGALRRAFAADGRVPGDPPRVARFLRGDCDGDGRVEGQVTDAVFLLTYNFLDGPAPGCLAACDVDGDGAVIGRVTDAVFLLTYNFLDGPPPPAPFPACDVGTSDIDGAAGCANDPDRCR